MKCRDYKCRKGAIDTTKVIYVKTGCASSDVAFPCSLCGRLHFRDGSQIQNRRKHRVFLKADVLVCVKPDGTEYPI